MIYGRIPGIKKQISRLIQGTIMCKTADQAYVNNLLDACVAHGINSFDTGHVYGSGECERSVGAWFNSRGIRDDIVLIGKGCHHSQDRQRVTPFDISADIADSLARFQTDTIDFYLLHRDDERQPVGPLIERLNEHVAAGDIQAFGGSNWTHKRIAAANRYAAEHGLTPMVATSPNFSLAYQAHAPWENCVSISGPQGQVARDWYTAQQMPILAWSSLAGGFFSGRFNSGNLSEFTSYFDKLCVDVYCFDENWQRLKRATELAAEKGVSLANIALAYVLNQPLPLFALIGSWKPEEVADNVKVLDVTLTQEEVAWLEGLAV